MLFVDSDIAFDPKSVLRLLEFDKDLVSIPYPMKTAQWDVLMEKIQKGYISDLINVNITFLNTLYLLKMRIQI